MLTRGDTDTPNPSKQQHCFPVGLQTLPTTPSRRRQDRTCVMTIAIRGLRPHLRHTNHWGPSRITTMADNSHRRRCRSATTTTLRLRRTLIVSAMLRRNKASASTPLSLELRCRRRRGIHTPLLSHKHRALRPLAITTGLPFRPLSARPMSLPSKPTTATLYGHSSGRSMPTAPASSVRTPCVALL